MKLFLKNKNNFFATNHCEIQVRTILVCALYSIKYGILSVIMLTVFYAKCNYVIMPHGIIPNAIMPNSKMSLSQGSICLVSSTIMPNAIISNVNIPNVLARWWMLRTVVFLIKLWLSQFVSFGERPSTFPGIESVEWIKIPSRRLRKKYEPKRNLECWHFWCVVCLYNTHTHKQ